MNVVYLSKEKAAASGQTSTGDITVRDLGSSGVALSLWETPEFIIAISVVAGVLVLICCLLGGLYYLRLEGEENEVKLMEKGIEI